MIEIDHTITDHLARFRMLIGHFALAVMPRSQSFNWVNGYVQWMDGYILSCVSFAMRELMQKTHKMGYIQRCMRLHAKASVL